MPSLKDCLGRAGKLFSPVEHEYLFGHQSRLIKEGMDEHEATLSVVKSIIKNLEGDLTSIIGQVSQASSAVTEATPKPPQTITGSNVQTGTEMPVQQGAGGAVWQKLSAPSEVILKLVENQSAATAKGEAGVGKKAARLFEDLDGVDEPDAVAELYKDSRAGGTRTESRKLAVLMAPDQSHVVIGTAIKQGKRDVGLVNYVTTYDESGQAVSKPLGKLLLDGWKLVGAIKTDEPTKGYAATYSPDGWASLRDDLAGLRDSSMRTAEVQEAKGGSFGTAGKKSGEGLSEQRTTIDPADLAEGSGERKRDAKAIEHESDVSSETVEVKGLTDGDIEGLFDDIVGATSDEDIIDKVTSRRGRQAILAIGRRLVQAGLTAEEIKEFLEAEIYGSYIQSGGDKKAFTKQVRDSIGRAKPAVGAVREGGEGAGPGRAEGAGRADAARSGASPAAKGRGQGSETRGDTGSKGEAAEPAEPPPIVTIDVDGLHFNIQKRRGNAFYGEVAGTISSDGMRGDVYLGTNPNAEKVWVIDQIDPRNSKFDEHKAMFGFSSQVEAEAAYDSGFPDQTGPSRRGGITEMDREEFVDWVNEGGYGSGPLSFGKKKRLTRHRSISGKAEGALPSKISDADVAIKFRRVVDALRVRGVDVREVKAAIADLASEFGKYQEWEGRQGELVRTITLALSDLIKPTNENFVTLLHEAGHAVFVNEAQDLQRVMEAAIDRVSNEHLGIGGFKEKAATSAIANEGRLVEAIAREFAAKGYDPAASTGAVKAVWRMLQAIYYRCALRLARVFGATPSDSLARSYLSVRLKQMLAGDSAYSFTTFAVLKTPIERNRDLSFTTDTETGVSPDLNSTALAEKDVAAQNEVDAAIRVVYDAWTLLGHNPSGVSFDQFVKSNNFVSLDEMPADVIARVNQRLANGKQAPVDPALRVKGVTSDSQRQYAALSAHRILTNVLTGMSERRRESEAQLKTLPTQLARNNTRLAQLTSDYTNADLMLQNARTSIKSMLGRLKKSVKAVKDSGHKLGTLEQVIAELEGKLSTPLMAQYEAALNRQYEIISGTEGGNKFVDMLERVAGLGVDWESDPAQKIKETIHMLAADPLLNPLTLDTNESRALLALTVAFGKQNADMMAALELRKTTAIKEREVVNKALALAMTDGATAMADAAKMVEKLPKLARAADRLLRKVAEAKRRNRDLIDEIQRYRTFVDFHHDTAPLLKQEMGKLEKVFGATYTDWQPTHGANYYVPQKPGDSPAQVAASKAKLDLKRDNMATVRGNMKKMADWLDSIPNGDRGAMWNTINQQYNRLALHDIQWGFHAPIQGSFVNRLLAPLTDRLRFVGTPAARSAAARLEKMVFWQSSLMKPAHEIGVKWEVAEGDAMAAMGIKRKDVFRRLIYNASLKLIENRQDLLAATTNPKSAEDLAVGEALKHLTTDPQTAGMMTAPGAAAAVERYLRQTARNAEFMENNRREMGIKVLDETRGHSIYRETIGASPFTIVRGLNEEAQRTALAVAGWDVPKRSKVVDAYNNAPDLLRNDMAKLFTPEIWNRFVVPIARRTGRSAFYAPMNPDGTYNFAMRERVMKAEEAAGGDVVRFAENLFMLEGGKGDKAEFIAETLHTLFSFQNQLQAVARETEAIDEQGLPTPKRFLADARKSEEFPAEWLDYMPYDIHTMRQVVKAHSYQAAFGRNIEAMRRDMETAKSEQEELQRKRLELEAAHPGLNGKKLEQAMKADAAARGWAWTPIKEAQRNNQTMTDVADKFNAMLKMNSTRPPEIEPWSEIVGTLSGLAVAGPATAFTDTIAIFEQPFRRFGFSMEAVKQIASSTKSLAVQTYGSLLQAIGQTTAAEARYNKLLMELGYYDDDAMLTVKQRLKALVTEQSKANALVRPAVYAARAARTVLSTGIGRAKPGAEAVFPTAKPHSVFTWQAQLVHAAEIVGWWKTYERLVAEAVKHFNANQADLSDPKFQFAPKQLGMSGRAWDYITNSLARYGMSLEQVAKEATVRRATDSTAPLLTKDQYRALAAQAQNEITLESNIATRPPFLMTNHIGNLANPLLGWAIEKGYDAWRGFRNPDGVRSMNGMRSGLLAYAAILPIGLAYALMRDKYDEEIIGRKQNVRDITTVNGQFDALATMVDNMARVGTFGILGEIPNRYFNYDTQRDFSVDNRVFFVNSLLGLQNSMVNWLRQGGVTDWQSVGRPLMQALGGGGYLQYAGMLNTALGMDNQEARVSNRISVNNYLRVAGRELNMDVRTSRGMQSLPNPIKPYVGQMVVAALANDAQEFARAKANAIQAAMAEGKKRDEAMDYVKRSFAAYHPLKLTFRTEPSEQEYRRLLAAMDENGQVTVATAVRMFNHYGEQVRDAKGSGINPSLGRKETAKAKLSLSLDQLRQRAATVY